MFKLITNMGILAYQKFISPHKGYRCAHAAYQGEESCSEHVRQVVLTSGVIAGVTAYKSRTEECKDIFLAAKKEEEDDSTGELITEAATEGACVILEVGACSI